MTMRLPNGVAGAFALAALLSASGCATKGDLRSVSNEIRGLQVRQDSILAELRFQSSATQDTLRTTTRDLLNMRGELVRRLTEIQSDIDQLTMLTGEVQRGNAAIRDQFESGRRQVVPPRAGEAPLTDGGGDATALYEAAVSQMNRNQLGTARVAFEDFLDQFPTDELAPRAHYFIAEIHLRENRTEEAIAEWLLIRERFPADPKTPDAIYRVGQAYAELGETAEARRYLETVVNTWPDDPIASLARQALRELGGLTR